MRALFSTLAVLMMLFVTGCSGGDPSPPEQPTAQGPAEPSPGAGSDGLPIDPDVGGAPGQEGATEAPQERSNSEPVLRIAGLPAGTERTVLTGETWCGAVATGTTPGDGVRLVVDGVRTDPAGLAAVDVACEGAPACLGATLDAGHTRCAVAVVPPRPPTTPVRAALDVRLECDTAQLCADYLAQVRPHFWWTIAPPAGTVGPEGPTGDGSTGDGTSSGEPPSPSPTVGEGGP